MLRAVCLAVMCCLLFSYYEVLGEHCTCKSECVLTYCDNEVICLHTAGVGLCTCSEKCVHKEDCHGNKAPNLTCHDALRHCFDGVCECDTFPHK